MNQLIDNKKENSENQEKKDDSKNFEVSKNGANQSEKEIDIFSKEYGFDENFIDRMLKKDCKWRDKKEAFDKFANYTDPTKIKNIKNSDRTYFIEMIKKLLQQPNINVVHSIINALNNLSIGLNSNFTEAKDLITFLLNFLKEKKESLINSLITCLCNFSLYMNDNILSEKLLNYCSTKPLLCNIAKINLCTFFEKLIDKKNNIQLNLYISFLIKLAKYLDDPNQDVREKSVKLMAFIKYKKRDIFDLISNLVKLDKKKSKKIDEYEKTYINLSCNNTNKKNAYLSNNKKTENKINLSNLNLIDFENKLLDNNKPKNVCLNKNYIQNNESKKIIVGKKKQESSIISEDNYLNLMKENLIDNEEKIILYVQTKIKDLDNSLFNSLNWKEKKEAFKLLNKFLLNENNLGEIKNSYDYYFKYILIKNGFFINEEDNLVLIESILCINTLIDKVNDFSEKYYKVLISLLINRLGEKKLIKEIEKIIQKLANKISSDEVILVFLTNLKNKVNPILNEGIEIIKNIIENTKNDEKILISDLTQSKYYEIYSISKSNDNLSSNTKELYNKSDKFQISKSPLVSTKKDMSKYNYNIIDVLPPEQSELPNYIQNLYGNDITCINLSLVEIKKILIHSIEKNIIKEKNIKDILFAFNNLLFSIYKNLNTNKGNISKNEIILLRYLLDDYILIVNRKSLILNINDTKFIYNCYEKLFLFLSSKELQNLGTDILSIINTIIMCLLTNFNKTLTIKTLIKIISDYKSNTNNQLICSLAIKCLNKFRVILSKIKNRIDNNSIFISLYDFFDDFSKTNKNLETYLENERNALLMINSIITEYIAIYKNSIWEIYNKSLNSENLKFDTHFKKSIEVLLKDFNSKKMLESKKNFYFLEQMPFDNNNDNDKYKVFIEEIMPYINELKNKRDKMTIEEENNCYYGIISSLRLNKINISVLSNKIDGDIFAKILNCYYGINPSEETKEFSQISQIQYMSKMNLFNKNNKKIGNSPFKKTEKFKNEEKENKTKNNLKNNEIKITKKKENSDQTKRIIEYKKKVKYLTESNKEKNQRFFENNNENQQMNININSNKINNNNLVENTIKKFDHISLKNNDYSNNKNDFCFNEVKADEVINMKKKLAEIRKKVN